MKKLRFILAFFICVSFVSTAQKVKVGIAGMTHGHVGQAYSAAKKSDDVVIVGFAEPNKALGLKLLKEQNLPDSLWFPTLEALIAKTHPDAVCAFNSIYEHLQVVETCAPKGIHVMVEKPLAVNMEHLQKMQLLVQKHPIHLLTNFETTWYPSHAKAWKMIKEDNVLGELRKVVIMDGHRGPMEIDCAPEFLDWLTDPIMNGGGAIIDFGCYGANIMTWLMEGQKPLSVTAVTQQLKPKIYPNVDDEATIVLNYPNCQAIIQASWNWPFDRKDTEIYGTKGILIANKEMQMKHVTGDRFGKETFIQLQELEHDQSDVFPYLAAVVKGRIQPKMDLSSLKINEVVVEILAAAVESAKLKKTVFLKK